MSMYIQSLSEADQLTLSRLDFRPLIGPVFTKAEGGRGHGDVDPYCGPCYYIDFKAFPQRHAPGSKFLREDLQDFCKIWLEEHVDQNPKHDTLCGDWAISGWRDIGEDAITIVQYKTFRICIRTGRNTGLIMISTADIRELIYEYFDKLEDNGETIPQCVAYSSKDGGHPFQWLIIPVSEHPLRDSIHQFADAAVRGIGRYDPRRWQVNPTALRVRVDPVTLKSIKDCGGRKYLPELVEEPVSIEELDSRD